MGSVRILMMKGGSVEGLLWRLVVVEGQCGV
jgi:hypothetical protein